jgi:hypothetical protein
MGALQDDLRRLLAGGCAGLGSPEDSLEMPTSLLIERATLEAIAGKQNVAALIELGKLRYAVGHILKRDVEAIFSQALR